MFLGVICKAELFFQDHVIFQDLYYTVMHDHQQQQLKTTTDHHFWSAPQYYECMGKVNENKFC